MRDPKAQLPIDRELSDDERDLFGDFRCLLPITVEGVPCWVPEDTSVLRALQYVELNTGRVRMEWGRYCWNNSTGCCEMEYRDRDAGPSMIGRACQLAVKPRLEIVRLPKGGRVCRKPRSPG